MIRALATVAILFAAGCGSVSEAPAGMSDGGSDGGRGDVGIPAYPACPTIDTTWRPCTPDSWLVFPNVGVRGVVIEYAACGFMPEMPCSLPVRIQHDTLGFDTERYIFCAPYTTDEYGEPLCPAFAAADGGT
jgi:hypothetical protein